MKLKKTYITIAILFSIVTTWYSCKGQTNNQNGKIPLQLDSTGQLKLKLDSQARILYHDSKDNFWFSSDQIGLYKYDGNILTLFSAEDGLSTYRFISIQEDSLGNLYFDTPEGVYKYDGEKFTTLVVADLNESENEWNLEPGDLWFRIGWDKRGPYRFDGENLYHLKFPKNKMEDIFYQENPNASINPYAIYSIYEDSRGNIWFGTSNLGVYLFDGNEIRWMFEKQLIETPEGGNFGIRSISEDIDGNYWISNANYKYSLLPNKKDGDGLKSLNYERQVGIENTGKENLYFYSMQTDPNGDLFMFAKDYGLWLNNGEELTQFFIKSGERKISPTSLFKDNNGVIWLGTDSNGIYKYDGNTFEKFLIK